MYPDIYIQTTTITSCNKNFASFYLSSSDFYFFLLKDISPAFPSLLFRRVTFYGTMICFHMVVEYIGLRNNWEQKSPSDWQFILKFIVESRRNNSQKLSDNVISLANPSLMRACVAKEISPGL